MKGCNKVFRQSCANCSKVKDCEVVKLYQFCYAMNKRNPANKK